MQTQASPLSMGRWLCQGKLNHLSHPDLALLPLANDAKLSKEAINLGGTHRNGMQSIVEAHGQALGSQENLNDEYASYYPHTLSGHVSGLNE